MTTSMPERPLSIFHHAFDGRRDGSDCQRLKARRFQILALKGQRGEAQIAPQIGGGNRLLKTHWPADCHECFVTFDNLNSS